MKLKRYREKRDPRATNEPMSPEIPALAPTMVGAYVVHLHDATREHYDLRLESGGVLASFAVPKGPTLDPYARHLAIHTEDHPFEYLDFEAVIPEGQYGAGPMIVWDRGRVQYLDSPIEEGLLSGKIDFVLRGQKLNGRFALVRLKGKSTEWLLLKKRDAFSSSERNILTERPASVLSGLTIQGLLDSAQKSASLRDAASRLGPRSPLTLTDLVPRGVREVPEAPVGPTWSHHLLMGGLRAIVSKSDAHNAEVIVPPYGDVSFFYPEITRSVLALPASQVTFEGEIVCFDDTGRPSPTLLRQRLERFRLGESKSALINSPVTFLASELLTLAGFDLRGAAESARWQLLNEVMGAPGFLRPMESISGDAAPLVAFAKEHALEGVISKLSGGDVCLFRLKDPMGLIPHTQPKVHSSRGVHITNPNKVFWPEDNLTKGDLCRYYEKVSGTLLPYLADRPIVVVRYPDGIHGKSFYQWNPPPGIPSWVGSVVLRDDDHAKGEKRAFLANDARSLLFLANLGCIPIHVLAYRTQEPTFCDFLTIDFDLKGAPFEHAVTLALSLREILAASGLTGYPKTSGQTGLHVLVPLGPKANFSTAKSMAELLGTIVTMRNPELATMERVLSKRSGKVYVDTGQTGPSRTIVAPYSVRATPGARVSTPITWEELPEIEPAEFTMRSVPLRVAKTECPMRHLLAGRPDLSQVAERLGTLLA